MEAIVLSWIASELNPINIPISLFIRPNILLWNRPEVFAFKSDNLVFIVESGSGGIYGHAHGLTEVKSPTTIIDGAIVYFTLDEEYMHSHPNNTNIYYIAKTLAGEYAIFDSATKTQVSHCAFSGLHWHSLHIREVIIASTK
jgi:hypothetical protein